ncbi:hypothetical protein Cgig2_027475 [Carnegiea gigantea]|uniref:Uncharacterized protein n=1 Tax=Carnegiea gigantea TaxID=171969 RepID=A0A9Q1KNA7_9CARY|nr:hypothetical protein Cgig2_027475 [Carnegiea gigantea]
MKRGTNKRVGWRGAASPLLTGARRRLRLVLECHARSQRLSTLPLLDLHKNKMKVRSAPNIKVISIGTTNTLGKILKDQKSGHGEKEIIRKKLQLRLPVTRLALPPLRALHGLNCLCHKLGDGPTLGVFTYVKLEVAGHLSLLSCRLPKQVPHRFTLVPVRNISLA